MNEQQEELCLRDKDAHENSFEKRIQVLTVDNVKSFKSKKKQQHIRTEEQTTN